MAPAFHDVIVDASAKLGPAATTRVLRMAVPRQSHAEILADAHAQLAALPADHPRRSLVESIVRQMETTDSPWILAG